MSREPKEAADRERGEPEGIFECRDVGRRLREMGDIHPDQESRMTSAQLILISVTSAMVAVFVMLLVATIRKARTRDDEEKDSGD